MRTYSVAEARIQFLDMLEHVRLGETVLVTENGKPIARFSPVEMPNLDASAPDANRLRQVQRLFTGLPFDELVMARDKGRR